MMTTFIDTRYYEAIDPIDIVLFYSDIDSVVIPFCVTVWVTLGWWLAIDYAILNGYKLCGSSPSSACAIMSASMAC